MSTTKGKQKIANLDFPILLTLPVKGRCLFKIHFHMFVNNFSWITIILLQSGNVMKLFVYFFISVTNFITFVN